MLWYTYWITLTVARDEDYATDFSRLGFVIITFSWDQSKNDRWADSKRSCHVFRVSEEIRCSSARSRIVFTHRIECSILKSWAPNFVCEIEHLHQEKTRIIRVFRIVEFLRIELLLEQLEFYNVVFLQVHALSGCLLKETIKCVFKEEWMLIKSISIKVKWIYSLINSSVKLIYIHFVLMLASLWIINTTIISASYARRETHKRSVKS